MWQDFKEFVAQGNVLDLAVAVILGLAFGAIVSSLVDDIIMPLIGVILGGIDFSELAIQFGEATIAYGNFIQAVVNFLIIAFVIFLIVRAAEAVQRPEEEAPEEPSTEEKLLREIRDLLEANLRR
ncbi:MAG TPA: large conductance mechanosensitive channel protein MscL [Candidatus Sulfomarinibacteraceae bacterium]|nr:large conductance mechanosensitive channel protein MscL [Candidatus Sulfomarinibacteraceae bacterium]